MDELFFGGFPRKDIAYFIEACVWKIPRLHLIMVINNIYNLYSKPVFKADIAYFIKPHRDQVHFEAGSR